MLIGDDLILKNKKRKKQGWCGVCDIFINFDMAKSKHEDDKYI